MTTTKTTRFILAVVALATVLNLRAQTSSAPQGINYQSVARNASGQILTNQQIALEITIHDTTSGGAIVYREHHTVVTNAFGTFSVVVGGGSIITGTLGGINWGASDKYMEVGMDFSGGTSYTSMGVSKLNSVPYALYAGSSSGDITNLKYDTAGFLNIQTASHLYTPVKGTWLTGGNGNLSTTNNYLGTTDNIDIAFIRGAKEAVRYTTGGAMLATGDAATGVTPASGAGKRMMWIPAKGAFRAGTVTGTAWNDANIGANSTALGNDAMAFGANSVAIGNNAVALYNNSIAMGNGVITKATNSMVIGTYNDTSAAATGSISQSDVLFQVGNGTASSRGNALTVGKSGQVIASQLLVSQSMSLSDTLMNVSGNFTITPNYTYYRINSAVGQSAAQLTMNSGNRPGQVILIECVSGNGTGHGIRLVDGTATRMNLTSSYGGGPIDLAYTDTMMLLWDGNTWIQIGGSTNN
ncbi:MAG: hypothetical protein JWO03_1486 [Bacteroidetes bacterium]|nr:hypothetical protein [Bacteroidota bacterium]